MVHVYEALSRGAGFSPESREGKHLPGIHFSPNQDVHGAGKGLI